ncbi:MAG TPA: SDR family NAD(P)-dependent oxidoreductase [Candidatus Desulfovibrio gallistercoris]|nr:SDR family NAD(P)-dependent oxidoreductase [Candidatus Desulfovibrio gallistercoris]
MAIQHTQATWLITGCSSGFGRNLAETALEQGKQVIVTARTPETLEDLVRRFPETAIAVRLDVTDDASVAAAVKKGMQRFGAIDVLVNNAGYCLRGAVEECSEIEIRRQFDTNFGGTVRTIQYVLPYMRKAHKGAIVNFSSIAALNTSEGSAFYGASKCAVEGLSDGLRKEVAPLGIKVMVVEPGPFKTDFFYRSIDINDNNIDDYRQTAGKRKVRLQNPDDSGLRGWGDLRKAAGVIIKAVEMPEGPFRLLLGSAAVKIGEQFVEDREREIRRWASLSVQTDA